MLKLKIWTWTLACWTAITYVLCVLWALVAPSRLHTELMVVSLPGFGLTAGGILIGLVESLVYGAYAGVVLVLVHNLFFRRWGAGTPRETGHA
jgi:hypothetical protein